MSDVVNIKKNFIFSLIAQIVTIIMGLIIPRITLVGYGSEVNGLLNSVTQFIAYLILFEAGIQTVATKSLYKTIANDEKQSTNAILSAVNKNYKKIGFLYFVGLLLLSFIFPLFTVSSNISYFTIFCVCFFSGFGNVIAFFYQAKYKILLTAEGKGYLITNINLVVSILNHLLKIVLLYLKVDVAIIIFLSFVVSLLQVLYINLYVNKNYKWLDLKVTPNFSALKHSESVLVHQISSLIFSNTDVLILTIFCGLKVVSLYAMYKLIVTYISSFLSIPINSSKFKLGHLYNKDKYEFVKIIDVVEVYFSVLCFAVLAVTMYLFLPFMALYASDITDISYVDKYLPILFVVIELLSFARVVMGEVIIYAGKFKETLSHTIVESSINLISSLILVNIIGIYGVLLGTILALLYRTTIILIYANKEILQRSAIKTFAIYIVNIIIFIAVYLVLKIIPITINSYLDFILMGLILTPSVLIVFFIINSLIFKSEGKYFISLTKRFLKKKS